MPKRDSFCLATGWARRKILLSASVLCRVIRKLIANRAVRGANDNHNILVKSITLTCTN